MAETAAAAAPGPPSPGCARSACSGHRASTDDGARRCASSPCRAPRTDERRGDDQRRRTAAARTTAPSSQLGDGAPPRPIATPGAAGGPDAVPDDRRGRLPRLLFHGPLFQGIARSTGMDERGAAARAARRRRRSLLSGADGLRWLLDPVLLDCALQMQVLWARLQWDVTLLPAEIGGYVRLGGRARREAGPPRAAHPRSRAARRCATPTTASTPPTDGCSRRSTTSSGVGTAGAEPARRERGRDDASAHDAAAGSRSSAWRACSRARPTSTRTGGTSSRGRRGHRPAAGGVGPGRLLRPGLRRTPTAIYCKRGGYLGALASFDPLAHGIPPIAVGGEPDQWLALRVARDALADAGLRRAARRDVRDAHGGHPRQGHLPQRRQRDRRAARPRRRADARADPQPAPRAHRRGARGGCASELKARAAAVRPRDRAGADPEHHRRAHRQPARPDGPGLHRRRRLRVLARRRRPGDARPARRRLRPGARRRLAGLEPVADAERLLPARRAVAPAADPAVRQGRRRHAARRGHRHGRAQARRATPSATATASTR